MAHEIALALINNVQQNLASIARGVVAAMADKKLTGMEGLMLGMQAAQLGGALLLAIEGTDAVTQKDILYCLEHGQWTMM